MGHPSAGDFQQSRVRLHGEARQHFQSDLGLASFASENRGGAGRVPGYGACARSLPGYGGHVPGQVECIAATHTKTTENALRAHLQGRCRAPQAFSLLTASGTSLPPTSSDTLGEMPLHNPSYQDRARGWSQCEFTGSRVDPAGRLAPHGRQEGFGGEAPLQSVPFAHGYKGFVPGRIGENIVGERECTTSLIATRERQKHRVRTHQR